MPAPEIPPFDTVAPLTRSRAREILRETALFLPRFAVLLQRLVSDPRVPRRNKWIAGAAAVYLLSPIDIVPDFVPGIGQLDDVVVVLFALHGLLNRVGEEVVLEHWDGDPDLILTLRAGIAAAARLLPGRWGGRI